MYLKILASVLQGDIFIADQSNVNQVLTSQSRN